MNVVSLLVTHNATLAAILMLGLGIWVYFDKRKDPKHVTFGTLLLVTAVWTLSLVSWRGSDNAEDGAFWLRSLFFVGSLIPLLFLIFSFSFGRGRQPGRLAQLFMAAPNILLFAAAYLSTSLVAVGADGQPILGAARTLFAAHFTVLLAVALAVLASASRSAEVEMQSKLLFVLVGAIIAFNSIFGILFGTTFTRVPDSLFIANIGLVIGMFFMASAILQKKFFEELKLLGPQLFTLLTLFVIIFNIVVTETTIDFGLRLTMLVILTCYAGLTTYTMLHQVRHAKQVEVLSERTLKMNDELMKADRMKSRFVSLASHQLRSPISGVKAYLQMLHDGDFGDLTGKQRDILGANVVALSRLSETIDTFLDAAKIQLGKLELYKADVSMSSMIERVVGELRPLAKKKGVDLSIDLARDIPDISCDEGKIMHVLANLVDNAVKYTGEGGRVTLSAVVEGGDVVVKVRDTGIGLSSDERAQVADVFNRGMEAVRLDTGGSGLGLYIAKNILEAHGAAMIFESGGRSKGSMFGFRMPLS